MINISKVSLSDSISKRHSYPYWPLILFLLFAGCATPNIPVSDQASSDTKTGNTLLSVAKSMIGVPYLYGGTGPKGFDCSGLVHYAHHTVGLNVPRSSREQRKRSRPVPLSRLRPGDLLFFRLSWRNKSHVGIYAGKGRFIHAPSSGKRVSYASLENPYWFNRLVAAGRLY
jgi:cell wall-associated NlpC family hydrolase